MDQRIAEDDGLSRERTELAWNRSGLAVLVAVAIMLRRLWPLEGYKSVLALSLIGAGALVWALAMRLARTSPADGSPANLSIRTARLLTVGTVILAVAGFVLGAISPS